MNFPASSSVLLITKYILKSTSFLILPLSNSVTLLSLRLYSLTRIFHKYFKQISKLYSFCSFCKLDPLPCTSECRRYQHTPFYSFSLSLKLTLTNLYSRSVKSTNFLLPFVFPPPLSLSKHSQKSKLKGV